MVFMTILSYFLFFGNFVIVIIAIFIFVCTFETAFSRHGFDHDLVIWSFEQINLCKFHFQKYNAETWQKQFS